MRHAAWAAVLLLTGGCEAFHELVTGPRYQVEQALSELQARPLTGPETRLDVRFVSDTIELDGERATAYARGEADGTYRGVPTRCICVEKVELVRTGTGWRTEGFPLARLEAVVDVLEARRLALQAGDAEAWMTLVHPDYDEEGVDHPALTRRIRALMEAGGATESRIHERILRVERARAIVTETWELPDGMRGRSRYELRPHQGHWRFVSGLL